MLPKTSAIAPLFPSFEDGLSASLLDRVPDLIFILSEEGKTVYANRAPSGLNYRDIIGASFYGLLESPDLETLKEAMDRVRQNGEPAVFETDSLGRPGRKHWHRNRLSLLPGNQPPSFLLIASDITELKGVERELREDMATIEAVNRIGQMLSTKLEIKKLAQALTDTATKIVGAQRGAFFYRCQEEDKCSYDIFSFSTPVPPRAEPFLSPQITKIFRPAYGRVRTLRVDDLRADPLYEKIARYLGPAEISEKLVSFLAVPMVSDSGGVTGGLFFGHSSPGVFTPNKEKIVTYLLAHAAIAFKNAHLYEQVQKALLARDEAFSGLRAAQDSLRQSHKGLELAQKAGHIGTFEWDIRSNRIKVSGELEVLYGLEAGGFPHKYSDWLRLLYSEDRDRVNAEIQGVLQSGLDLETEFRIRLPDKRIRWILSKGQVFTEPLRMVGIHIDITLRKEAEEVLRESEKRQKDFVANVSHEFRTPLATIKGLAETLKMGGLNDLKHRMKFVSNIEKHTDRLEKLVEELLTLSSLESGKAGTRANEFSLSAFAKEFALSLAPIARKNKVAIRVRTTPGVKVFADKDHLTAVFQNILSNAIKFNRKGGWIEVRDHVMKNQVIVSISDGGVGIPQGDLSHIFDRFYRGSSTKSEKPGTGLGLSIAKQIVESYGGRIWAESIEERGTTFHFTIPLAQ